MFSHSHFKEPKDCNTAGNHTLHIMKEIERYSQDICGSYKIPNYHIYYPKSIEDFNEVKILNKVINNEELLKEAWEKVRHVI